MKKIILFLLFLLPCPALAVNNLKEVVNLNVPFVSESPENKWSGNWLNACEEASVIMIDAFYLNQTKVSVKNAVNSMNELFAWENKIFKSTKNTNATETIQMIVENNLSFIGTIVSEPTLEQIQNELRLGHPVISLHYGFDLKNPELRFLSTGSAYHMMVIKGFDENTQEFIVHDNGNRKSGIDYRYKYDTLMSSLHDYNRDTDKTDGLPTVIFTKQYFTAKVAGSPAIYLVEAGIKKPFTSGVVFKQMGWQYSQVRKVYADFLNNLSTQKMENTEEESFVAKIVGTPAIYLIENGIKKPFPSGDVFKQMGWQYSQVRRVTAEFLNNLPTQELIY